MDLVLLLKMVGLGHPIRPNQAVLAAFTAITQGLGAPVHQEANSRRQIYRFANAISVNTCAAFLSRPR